MLSLSRRIKALLQKDPEECAASFLLARRLARDRGAFGKCGNLKKENSLFDLQDITAYFLAATLDEEQK
ncbi:hypothetical protein I79_014083 [Cricetulus griseus]|uniref:Uncharacterized protein n=1 Tax=Cricetulus griseus TaxID=10029 RepID=G3HT65_CRIGR|nr:hypothetical protein I79_014083 [Cricetulus griseus]ERE83858.1 hypothetical protein H671_2g6432 [Cricetulus griseus]